MQAGCCLPVHAFSPGLDSPCAAISLPCGQGTQTDKQMQSGKASSKIASWLHLTGLMCPAHAFFADSLFSTNEHKALQAFTACTCHKVPIAAAGFQHELESVFIMIVETIITSAG